MTVDFKKVFPEGNPWGARLWFKAGMEKLAEVEGDGWVTIYPTWYCKTHVAVEGGGTGPCSGDGGSSTIESDEQSPAEKILEGMREAVAYARGDESAIARVHYPRQWQGLTQDPTDWSEKPFGFGEPE